MSTVELPLSKIQRDGGTQPRSGTEDVVVKDYAEAMSEGAKFPPLRVFFDGVKYWLTDGFHRYEAAERIGFKTYACEIVQGTMEDAQWDSYGANKAHGLRRSNLEKQRAVEKALKHPSAKDKSTREIAEHCGVSHMTVQRYRTPVCNIVTDGTKSAKKKNGESPSEPKSSPSSAKTEVDTEPQSTPASTPEPEIGEIKEVEAPPDNIITEVITFLRNLQTTEANNLADRLQKVQHSVI